MEATPLLQGTLDLLILQSLRLGEHHGLGVARRIAQITGGRFDVKPGSLFPALHRMQQAGWLAGRGGESETNRRAKYYRLTRAGRARLEAEAARWRGISDAMGAALAAAAGEKA